MDLATLRNLNTGEKHYLLNTATIGSDPDNDIVLHDKYVAGKHAVIYLSGTTWYISDCSSGRGVEKNPVRVPANGTSLNSGDKIKLGDTYLLFSEGLTGSSEPKDPPAARTNTDDDSASKVKTGSSAKLDRGQRIVLWSAVVLAVLFVGLCFFNHAKGDKYMSEGDYPKACKAYRGDMLFSNEDCYSAAMLAGEYYVTEGDYGEAATYFKYAGEKGAARYTECLLEAGEQACAEKDYPAAIQYFKEAGKDGHGRLYDAIYEYAKYELDYNHDFQKAATLLDRIEDGDIISSLKSIIKLQKELQKARPAEQTDEDSSWNQMQRQFVAMSPSGTMIGRYSRLSEDAFYIVNLEELYSYLGTEPHGKVLMIAQKTDYSSKETRSDSQYSQGVLLNMMQMLPKQFYPESLSEVEYVVFVSYDYEKEGHYSDNSALSILGGVGPDALREKAEVQILHMPDGDVVYESETVLGPNAPDKLSVPANMDIVIDSSRHWGSGNAPNMGKEIYSALSTIIS